MRKIVCLLIVALMCMTMAVSAFAAENTFVPSISYKDGPEVEKAEQNGETVTGCVVVTSLKEASQKTTDVTQEDRDLLLDVYKQLEDGSMELPLDGDYVIRELVDVSYKHIDCREPHDHAQWLKEKGNTVSVTFDLGVGTYTEVVVMVYVDGQWVPAEKVTNNGNGTVTVVFEDLCPVAFCVEAGALEESPKTGDAAGADLMLWIGLMVAAFGAIVVMVLNRRKFVR